MLATITQNDILEVYEGKMPLKLIFSRRMTGVKGFSTSENYLTVLHENGSVQVYYYRTRKWITHPRRFKGATQINVNEGYFLISYKKKRPEVQKIQKTVQDIAASLLGF